MTTPVRSAASVSVKTRLPNEDLNEHIRVWQLLSGLVDYAQEKFEFLARVDNNIGRVYEFSSVLTAELFYDTLNSFKRLPLKLTLEVREFV